MAKKTKSVHVDKYAPDAAEANKALIQLNKRWANRVVVDTMLPQKQPATAPNSQLEEPLAQWELDILNRPISTPSSDERPVIDWRPKYDDDFDYFNDLSSSEASRIHDIVWPLCRTCKCDIDGHELSDDNHDYIHMTDEERLAYENQLDSAAS